MSIQIRIFLGCLQNSELKMHLDKSTAWKEAKTMGILNLSETRWQEKDYLGFFIPPLLSLGQLKENEREIKTQLQLYCPKINVDSHACFLFTQIFFC
jgi:hypothetical protein